MDDLINEFCELCVDEDTNEFWLPKEIWTEIFEYLDLKTLGRCYLMCWDWKNIVDQILKNDKIFKKRFENWWNTNEHLWPEKEIVSTCNSWRESYEKCTGAQYYVREIKSGINLHLQNSKSYYFIYLASTRIYSYPKQLFQLDKLKMLNISNSDIAILPDVSGLKSLVSLYCCFNRLPEFPKSLLELKTLKELAISGNQIQCLPKDITVLTNLSKLELDKNPLEDIPDLRSMKNLKGIMIDEIKSLNNPHHINVSSEIIVRISKPQLIREKLIAIGARNVERLISEEEDCPWFYFPHEIELDSE